MIIKLIRPIRPALIGLNLWRALIRRTTNNLNGVGHYGQRCTYTISSVSLFTMSKPPTTVFFIKKSQKIPKSKVKISLSRELGKWGSTLQFEKKGKTKNTLDYLKLLCKEGVTVIVKKKEDQSKSQDDLELKKKVPADQSCTFQDHNLYIPKVKHQDDLKSLDVTVDLELKKKLPADQSWIREDREDQNLTIPEIKSLDFTEHINEQFDLGDLNQTDNYLGSKVNQEEQYEECSYLMKVYNCDLCDTPFSAEHFVIAHLKKHHKLFKDFENCIKITERKI